MENNTGAWIFFGIFVLFGLSVISPLLGKIIGWSVFGIIVGFVLFYHFIWDTKRNRQRLRERRKQQQEEDM